MWKPKIGDKVMRRYVKYHSDLDEIGEIVEERYRQTPFMVKWPDGSIKGYNRDQLIPDINGIIKEKDAKIKVLQDLIDHITRDGFLGNHKMTDDQIALLFEAKGWSVSW